MCSVDMTVPILNIQLKIGFSNAMSRTVRGSDRESRATLSQPKVHFRHSGVQVSSGLTSGINQFCHTDLFESCLTEVGGGGWELDWLPR